MDFIPPSVLDVLTSTVERTRENEADVPIAARHHHLDRYDRALEWLNAHEPLTDLTPSDSIVAPTTDVEPGDYFRALPAGDQTATGDWKLAHRTAKVQMEHLVIAYADPETGHFEGLHTTHDSNTLELLALCRDCGTQQATALTPPASDDLPNWSRPYCPECQDDAGPASNGTSPTHD